MDTTGKCRSGESEGVKAVLVGIHVGLVDLDSCWVSQMFFTAVNHYSKVKCEELGGRREVGVTGMIPGCISNVQLII